MSENMNQEWVPSSIDEIRNRFTEEMSKNGVTLPLETMAKETDSLKSSYSGRELLELVQNADDAYSEYLQANPNVSEKRMAVTIDYDGNCLTVCNKGVPFSLKTIHRLGLIGASRKENVIGCKGKGFRSLLNFSEEIFIYSGEYAFSYTRENADKEFAKIKNFPLVQDAVSHVDDFSYPIFLAPVVIERKDSSIIERIDHKECSTVIQIKLRDDADVRSAVERQINEFDSITLLFLPTVSSLIINNRGKKIEYTKQEENLLKSLYSVKKIEDKEEKEKASYYFFETKDYVASVGGVWKITPKIKGAKILHRAVAIPIREQNSFKTKNVYSFFVVRKEYSPFPVYFHSTFKLNEHRDEIVEKENPKTINRFIARELLSYYVEIVKDHFLTPDFGDYSMHLLTPNGFKILEDGTCDIGDSFLKDFNLLDEYVEKIKSVKFIYTVNNEFISDFSEVINCEKIPDSFKAPFFDRLIVSNKGQKEYVLPFLRKYFGLHDLTPEEICKRINEMASSLKDDSATRMGILYWWIENICKRDSYFNEKEKIYYPKIVKTDAQSLTNDVKNCYLTGGAVQEPPTWATITVIDSKDEENLSILYAEKIKRKQNLESLLKKKPSTSKRLLAGLTGFCEQSNLDNLVDSVNSCVSSQEQAIKFISWLYDVYVKMQESSRKKLCANDSIVVPSADGFCKKGEAYLGAAYGNIVGEPICASIGKKALIDPACLIDSLAADREVALSFFRKLGIVKFPMITQVEFGGYPAFFEKFLESKASKPNENFEKWLNRVAVIEEKFFDPRISAARNSEIRCSHVLSIECINKILELPTKVVLEWILTDEDLYNKILNKNDQDAELFYKKQRPGRTGYGACGVISTDVPNFIQYCLANDSWVDVNGKHQNIVSTTRAVIEEQSWYIQLMQNSDYKDKLPRLLIILGMRENTSSLSPELFFRNLYEMGEDPSRAKEAVKLYNEIADPQKRELFKDKIESSCYEKEKFKRLGKVWAVNRNGEAKFCLAKEVYFTSSAVLNFENKFIMKTPARVGQYEVFNAIFGVKKYEENIVVQKRALSDFNAKFKDDFKEFLPYFLALRSNITSDVIEKCKKLEIELLQNACITINGKTDNQEVSGGYTVLRETASRWSIVIGSSLYNRSELALALKTIFYVVFDHPSDEYLDICELLFMMENPGQRERKLKEKNAEDDYIRVRKALYDRTDYENNIKTKFAEKMSEDVLDKISAISFDNFDSHDNLPAIQSLIEALGVSVKEFNTSIGTNISFVKINRNKLESAFDAKESVVRSCYVEKIASAGIEEKIKLDDFVFDCKNNVLKDIPNEIPFNENAVLEIRLRQQGITDLTKTLSEEMYPNNVTELRKKLGVDEDYPCDSNLLYFNIAWDNDDDPMVKFLLEKFKKAEQSPEPNSKEIHRLPNAKYVGKVTPSDRGPISSGGNSGGAGGGTYSGEGGEPKLNLADSAEYEVYEQICDKSIEDVVKKVGDYTRESVHWVSGAAHRKNKTRGNDRKGYDIEVCGKNCTLHVEVKCSTSDGCSFFMSSNEMRTASSDENYVIIFVGGVASENPQIQFVGNPFLGKNMNLSNEGSPYISSVSKYRIDYQGEN